MNSLAHQLRQAACAVCLLLLFPLLICQADDPGLQLLTTRKTDQHVRVHAVQSSYQSGITHLRVLMPDKMRPNERLAAIYLLPVEAGLQTIYGDAVEEVLKHDLHNRHRLVYIAPSFSHLPWYADHPSERNIQQESYLLKHVIPFVEKLYPVRRQARHRHLVGFSKSGWGAFTLTLRHPQMFGLAAAWDAPMMMAKPGNYGSGPIFAGDENFQHYQVSRLVEEADQSFKRQPRLILTGYAGSFRQHHIALHELMQQHGVKHQYRDGPMRKHDWHSGWLAESLQLMFR